MSRESGEGVSQPGTTEDGEAYAGNGQPEVLVHHLAAVVHGRYLLEPSSDDDPSGLLVGFHGYGEDAEAHLEQLRRIPGSERWDKAAIQALHPFYTRKGDVVASWMTKLDREQAIDDNIRYAAAAVSHVGRRLGTPRRLVYAGFSQGVAMAWRTVARGGHPCHGLMALAGDVPPEVAEAPLGSCPPVLLGRGTEDEWYTAEKMERDLEALASHGVEVETCIFDGGHVWDPAFLEAAGRMLARLE